MADNKDGTRPTPTRKRSSFFAARRTSFLRSGGARGANLEGLRGTTGADFEAKATVERRPADGVGCACFGRGAAADKDIILLVKGPFAFVFASEKAAAPKYAISLVHMKVTTAGPKASVETSLGDCEFEVRFSDENTANEFKRAASEQAAAKETEEIQKRLGHEGLLTKRSSVRYAESVAQRKINEQPEAPVTVDEIMSNIPSPMQ